MNYTQADIACLVAKAERDYLQRSHSAKVRDTVVQGDEVVVLDESRRPLARYRAHVTRFRVWIERVGV